MKREPREGSGLLVFLGASLFVLFGLSLFGAWISCLTLAFGGPSSFGATALLILAHAALPLLTLGSFVGMLFRRRWAWWTAQATFGLLGVMAALVAFLIVFPAPLLGGEVDLDWWPLSVIYAGCAWPGLFMLQPGRIYDELLR